MNVEALQIMAVAIISTILCSVLMWQMMGQMMGRMMGQMIGGYCKWLEVHRRADELLRTVLSQEQHSQLMWQGYVDIKSPRDQARIYRVPREFGRVEVIEQGRRTASLCLQPLEYIPGADIVVMHKLMIGADEETYLQTANRFPPSLGLDW